VVDLPRAKASIPIKGKEGNPLALPIKGKEGNLLPLK
jgi:hypothetical protein